MPWQYILKVAVTVAAVIGVAEISKRSSFWGALLASLPLFAILPALLGAGWHFRPGLLVSCLVTVGAYFALVWLLPRVGIQL